MELVIDIGNTKAKIAVFDGNEIVMRTTAPNDDLSLLGKLLKDYDIRRSIVSTVTGMSERVLRQLREASLPDVMLSHATVDAYNARYAMPPTSGSDRLAAVVEARAAHPGRPMLIVDNGTYITYEFITSSGEYLGGNIAPGVYMRLQAMHAGTAGLPLVSLDGDVPPAGYDTHTAMRAGAVTGTNYEIEGYVRHAAASTPGLLVIIAGGAHTDIDAAGAEIITDHDLVIKGLRRILLDTVDDGSATTNKR